MLYSSYLASKSKTLVTCILHLLHLSKNSIHFENFMAQSGMSEIRDRAQAAPVKSRKFRDNGLPVSG